MFLICPFVIKFVSRTSGTFIIKFDSHCFGLVAPPLRQSTTKVWGSSKLVQTGDSATPFFGLGTPKTERYKRNGIVGLLWERFVLKCVTAV